MALLVLSGSAPTAHIIPPTAPNQPVVIDGLGGDIVDSLGPTRGQEWTEVFSVFVTGARDVPPVLGEYDIQNGSVRFTPRFPFFPGQAYRVVFEYGEHFLEATFTIPVPKSEPTTMVSRVFPSADLLPENLLKFYVYFSAPMAGGDVYEGVHLVDVNDQVVGDAFVRTEPELWDPAMQRLTLICHPGRIKRGLELNRRAGPPLRSGESFRLVVDKLLDASGQTLAAVHEKVLTAGAADRVSPAPHRWHITTPPAGTSEPIRLDIGEPLDHALLKRLVAIERADGSAVKGQVELSSGETVWEYRPAEPWAAGRYVVRLHPALEDLAGNRLHRLFDDKAGAHDEAEAKEVRLSVVIE